MLHWKHTAPYKKPNKFIEIETDLPRELIDVSNKPLALGENTQEALELNLIERIPSRFSQAGECGNASPYLLWWSTMIITEIDYPKLIGLCIF